MRINYKTHPILEKLEKGSLGKIPVFEVDAPLWGEFQSFFVSEWKALSHRFKSEINIISEPFQQAATAAQKKLMDLISDILDNDSSDLKTEGVFIVGDCVYMIWVEALKGSAFLKTTLFVFLKDGTPLGFYFEDQTRCGEYLAWQSQTYEIPTDANANRARLMQTAFRLVIFKMFKSYAQVETKVLPPKKKTKDGKGNHLNETNLHLTYLDSAWFTTLVQSEGFKVRGHFRLQPKKVGGEWTKELIWIKDFEKHGYTRKAGILRDVE